MKGGSGPRISEKVEVDQHGRMQLIQIEPVFLQSPQPAVRRLFPIFNPFAVHLVAPRGREGTGFVKRDPKLRTRESGRLRWAKQSAGFSAG
jgi:hypothetical protein